MVEIKAENDDFTISGYICKPEILRSNRNDMNVFVNGRLIKNYDINKSINDVSPTYPHGSFCILHLNFFILHYALLPPPVPPHGFLSANAMSVFL